MDEHIPIGRFAALTGLSTKALRIYHENGLLEPASVDPASGYRYYAPAQVATAAHIALLRRAGIGLAEIAAHLDDPDPRRVDRWRRELDVEVAERRRLLDHIAHTAHREDQPMPAIARMPKRSALERAIPVLASLDIDATQRFYKEKLGFEPASRYPDYGICRRDGIEIHFWLTDDRRFPENTSCRVDVTGVDALYAEMKEAGVVHPNGPLTDQPWGMREFAILDGDGNLIKFGERIATSSSP